jgi:S1-C subfamily serine protease
VSDTADLRWRSTLERVARAVVTIRVDQVRGFDGENPSSSQATGFVVDAERGLILTNRHVVEAGPVVAQAVFLDHEEVALAPIYRDPVHDFGFFRYDPAAIRHMTPVALPLAPERAQVGIEIRVVGNDSGEKLSILAGTLARLDREAPQYAADRWSDFNTFYLQAASSTSGGSSGSPVVDVDGYVLALNAGARTQTATAYYLPLDRVVPALAHLRAGRPVPRGSVDAVFLFAPFDEVRRLGAGASFEAEARARAPGVHGMWVVQEVFAGGPSDGRLVLGDVVVAVDGAPLSGFVALEAALDAAVGGHVTFDVIRDGAARSVVVPVIDLHGEVPRAWLEVGGAVLHDVSIHQARVRSITRRGVFVAQRGAMFDRAGVPSRSVLTELAGVPVVDLADAERVLGGLCDGAEVAARYTDPSQPNVERFALIRMDRRWYPMARWERDDEVGTWHRRAAPEPPVAAPRPPVVVDVPSASGPGADVARSLVEVTFHVPYRVEGVHGTSFFGVGVVVDGARGLVVTDRDTVPIALGDARLTFGGSAHVAAEVVMLHPTQNVAVLRYDPSSLEGGALASARLDVAALQRGQDVWRVVLDEGEVHVQKAKMYRQEPLSLPMPDPPRFRAFNCATVTLGDGEGTGPAGVLVDADGAVRALWSCFSYQEGRQVREAWEGVPAWSVADVAARAARGDRTIPVLGAELSLIALADARLLGLPAGWAQRFSEVSRRRVLAVARTWSGTDASEVLRPGDLLLAVDGVLVRDHAAVEATLDRQELSLTVLRDRSVVVLALAPARIPALGIDRVVMWAGTCIHEPSPAVAAQRGRLARGPYVAFASWGSPANRFELKATRQIVSVDGVETPDLDAFLGAVSGREDRSAVRVRLVDLSGRPELITLELDLRYWPTQELRRGAAGWSRRTV